MKIIAISIVYLLSISSAPAMASPKVIPIGITAPLSGDFASYGESIQRGVMIAKQDLKSRGIHTKIHIEDACIPKDAIRALQKLITINRIEILVANFCAIAIPAMTPTIERNKLISFYSGGVPDTIENASEYIFSTNLRIKNEAFQLAEYAFHTHRARTAATLYISTDFGEDYNKYFTQKFIELGGSITYRATDPIGSRDFKAQLTKIKSKQPDIILAAHLGESLGILLKQARSLGIKQQFLGTYEAEDPSVLTTAQKAAKGLLFFTPEPKSDNKKAQKFRDSFVSKFKIEPDLLARNAYDATIIALKNYLRCNKETSCTKDRLRKIRDYIGVSGKITLDTKHRDKKYLTLQRL